MRQTQQVMCLAKGGRHEAVGFSSRPQKVRFRVVGANKLAYASATRLVFSVIAPVPP